MIDVYEWHDPWSWLAVRQKTSESSFKAKSSILMDDEVREALALIADDARTSPLPKTFTDQIKSLMVARGYPNIRSMPKGRRVEIVQSILLEVQ